jgi:pimeloyl-ACP methyl ester carboxylesterase
MLSQQDAVVIDGLATIRAPTLIVVGADDEPFIAASAYMAQKIPGARREVIADAGHWPHLDQPAIFADIVGAFIDALGA